MERGSLEGARGSPLNTVSQVSLMQVALGTLGKHSTKRETWRSLPGPESGCFRGQWASVLVDGWRVIIND